MQCIIFSFNRACQLDALLRSARKFCNKLSLDIHVVYNSSDQFFEGGYLFLKELFPEVHFVKEEKINRPFFLHKAEYRYWKNYYNYFKYPAKQKENSFKTVVTDILTTDASALIFFLTDDSLFIGEPSVPHEMEEKILAQPSQSSFSFRHGNNMADTPARLLLDYDTAFHYQVNRADSPHWTFRFSIDGHVYSTKFIRELLAGIYYYNPNSLESFANTYADRKNYFNELYFNSSNTLIGFELNRVQSFNVNNHLNFSTEKLNAYFLKQYQLSYLFSRVDSFRPVLNGLEFYRNGDSFQIKELVA